jgi:hypothetical protein
VRGGPCLSALEKCGGLWGCSQLIQHVAWDCVYRPPRPIRDAFFVPRDVLGHIGGNLMTTATPGVSTLQLYRQLGLNRYETA